MHHQKPHATGQSSLGHALQHGQLCCLPSSSPTFLYMSRQLAGQHILTMFWSCGATGLRATQGHHAHRAVSRDVTDMTSDYLNGMAEQVAMRRLSRTEVIVTVWVDERKPGNVRSWYSSTQCIQPLVLFTLDPSGLGCKGRCGT